MISKYLSIFSVLTKKIVNIDYSQFTELPFENLGLLKSMKEYFYKIL